MKLKKKSGSCKTAAQLCADNWISNTVEVAKRAFSPKSKKKSGNLISKKATKLMKKKTYLSKKLLCSRCPIAMDQIRAQLQMTETDLKVSLKNEKLAKESKILPAIKKDPGLFFSYAKSFATSQSDIVPLLDSKENLINDHNGMADILSSQ